MLNKLIAHRINKEQHKNEADLYLRPKILPTVSKLASDLLVQLREAFQKRNPIAGAFESTGGTQSRFQQLVLGYLDRQGEGAFIELTKLATQLLCDEMKRESLASGGAVVFAEYTSGTDPFILIALLSTTAKPRFDDSMNLVAAKMPDLDHLRHGVRVRLNAVRDNSDGVVQFISQRVEGVSDYFVDFIGCEAIIRPEAQGRHLPTALGAWAASNELSDTQRNELMAKAHGQWKECRQAGTQMTLTALANVLNPNDPDLLLQFLGNEEHQLAGEFSPPPPSIMKRFIRFAFNAEGLKLEFDRNQWENRVEVDAARRTLTIRDVPHELITAINEQE
jgi:nucleoid-associated protein